jgi:hypothetical protein
MEPELAQVARPNYSAITETSLAARQSNGTVTLEASIRNCQGVGLIASINVQYGTCTTDADGGKGFVEFSDGGSTVALTAKSQKGAEAVASSWQSNGPVNATSQICVTISVTDLSLKGLGAVKQQLGLSYTGAPQTLFTSSVTATGNQTYCGTVPTGATNVWWQLATLAGGSKAASQAKISVRLVGVSIT